MENKLQQIRENLHLSQEELAEKSGVTRQTISKIETNKKYNTTVGTLKKLSNALGCSIEEIFFR